MGTSLLFHGSTAVLHPHPHPLPLPSFLFLLFLFLCLTPSSSDLPVPSDPAQDWRSSSFHLQSLARRDVVDYLPRPQFNVTLPDPGRYSESLALELIQSATTWLHVRWQLQNRTGAKLGEPRFSRVRCHVGNATVVVHDIRGPGTRFRIPNLSSNTRYVVCVEAMESLKNYLHYRCAPFSTIPLVRPDSVLGLLLSLGYIALMSLIGYLTWCMRMRRVGHGWGGNKGGGAGSSNEVELSCRTSTIRFSEIEERVQLNSHASAPANSKLYSGQL